MSRIILFIFIISLIGCSPHRKTSFYKSKEKGEIKREYGTFNEPKKHE